MATSDEKTSRADRQSRKKGSRTVLGTYTLDECGIEGILEQVDSVLVEQKRTEKDRARLTLSLKTVLEKGLKDGLRDAPMTLTLEKSFLSKALVLETPDILGRPLAEEEYPTEALMAKTLELEGILWSFERRNGKIVARLSLPRRKLSSGQTYLVAIAAALATIWLLSQFPNNALQTFVDRFAGPLFDAGIGLFVALMGVMVFLSIVSCISGLNELSTLRKMGKTIAGRIMGANLGALLIAGAAGLFLLRGSISVDGGSSDITVDILDMIIGIIPASLFQPFIDGNVLQIAFWAVLFGVGLIILKPIHPGIVEMVNGLNALVQWGINQLARIMPAIIYLAIVRLSVSLSGDSIVMLLQYFCALAICLVLFNVLLIAIASRRGTLGFVGFFKELLPAIALGFLTASSNACFSTIVDTCKKLGVDEKLVNFHVSLALVLSHPGSIICFTLVLCSVIPLEGVMIGAPQFVVILLLTFIIGVATPSVAGGSVAMYTILFSSLGLSSTYLPLFVATDMLADMMLTTANITTDICTCIAVRDDLEDQVVPL